MNAEEDTKRICIVIEIPVPDDHSEDIDGRPKELEIDVAEVLESIPGVKLFHDKTSTGTKQGSYFDEDGVQRRVQPDIIGLYKGHKFVVDTKLKERSYVDQADVDKLHRDAKVLRAKPVMVHSGGKISEGKIAEIEKGGEYIGIKYQKPGWCNQLKEDFVARF